MPTNADREQLEAILPTVDVSETLRLLSVKYPGWLGPAETGDILRAASCIGVKGPVVVGADEH